jgi:nitrate reductase delta subunit
METRPLAADSFAKLFSYPDEQFRHIVDEVRQVIEAERSVYTSGNADQLLASLKILESLPTEEAEELYTRSFDINPVASLEVGWHLYGEQYERGAFLVSMRSLLRLHHIEESTELPDHLTQVLRAVGRMPQQEADEFAGRALLPALTKMLDGFKDQDNPYAGVLRGLKEYIERHHLSGVISHE